MKYLGIKIDENLNWKQQISDVSIKLNRENAILSKLKYVIDRNLKSVYHAIFEPHLYYSWLAWAQNLNSIKRHFALLKKSSRIIYFRSRNAHTSNKIALENWLFINKYFNKFIQQSLKIGLHFHLIFIRTVLVGPIYDQSTFYTTFLLFIKHC